MLRTVAESISYISPCSIMSREWCWNYVLPPWNPSASVGCLLCRLLSMSTIDGSCQKPPPTLDCLELLVTSTYCHKFDPCIQDVVPSGNFFECPQMFQDVVPSLLLINLKVLVPHVREMYPIQKAVTAIMILIGWMNNKLWSQSTQV